MGAHPVHGSVVAGGEPTIQIGLVLREVDVAHAELREAQLFCPGTNLRDQFLALMILNFWRAAHSSAVREPV